MKMLTAFIGDVGENDKDKFILHVEDINEFADEGFSIIKTDLVSLDINDVMPKLISGGCFIDRDGVKTFKE